MYANYFHFSLSTATTKKHPTKPLVGLKQNNRWDRGHNVHFIFVLTQGSKEKSCMLWSTWKKYAFYFDYSIQKTFCINME